MAEMYREDRNALLAEIDRMKLDVELKSTEISVGHWEEKNLLQADINRLKLVEQNKTRRVEGLLSKIEEDVVSIISDIVRFSLVDFENVQSVITKMKELRRDLGYLKEENSRTRENENLDGLKNNNFTKLECGNTTSTKQENSDAIKHKKKYISNNKDDEYSIDCEEVQKSPAKNSKTMKLQSNQESQDTSVGEICHLHELGCKKTMKARSKKESRYISVDEILFAENSFVERIPSGTKNDDDISNEDDIISKSLSYPCCEITDRKKSSIWRERGPSDTAKLFDASSGHIDDFLLEKNSSDSNLTSFCVSDGEITHTKSKVTGNNGSSTQAEDPSMTFRRITKKIRSQQEKKLTTRTSSNHIADETDDSFESLISFANSEEHFEGTSSWFSLARSSEFLDCFSAGGKDPIGSSASSLCYIRSKTDWENNRDPRALLINTDALSQDSKFKLAKNYPNCFAHHIRNVAEKSKYIGDADYDERRDQMNNNRRVNFYERD
eukprot:CAMPEP_0194283210 /NCGR_PEP_ID=MMETSP0169-20130528/24868_1 /TAXON_ID=218684 /ORGANISM="Corethron pennatum, Strain L29A3" /LENGTH=495 /DNA_ID=CAMNT_0039028759 /DNA_START=347 /DNA_END=1834 /DNA_ORIENTATION=+